MVDAATELAERGHEASWRVGGFAASGPPAARRRPAACCLDPLPPPPTGRLSQVTIYTPFHDPDRCFPETTSGAFRVLVAGGALPRSLGGRCTAACAYARCAATALRLVADSRASAAPYDVVFADQVSAVVPVLQWAGGLKARAGGGGGV